MKVYLKDVKLHNPNSELVQEVDESEIIPGYYKLIGHWRDPSFEIFKLKFMRNLALSHKELCAETICSCGKSITIDDEELYDHWQRGHFDVPIYEAV